MGLYRQLLKKHDAIYDEIPERYWMEVFTSKVINILRGQVKRIWLKKCGGLFYCGSCVKIKTPYMLSLGRKVIIGDFVKIQALSKSGVIIGDNVQIGDYSVINGTSVPTAIGEGMIIGDNCSFGEYCHFGAVGGLNIGSNVLAGQNVRFHAENHNFDDLNVPIREQGVTRKGIAIDDNCWIGAGAVFLDGTVLGNGCVVAANAVLDGIYPDNAVIIGAPGRVTRLRGEHNDKDRIKVQNK